MMSGCGEWFPSPSRARRGERIGRRRRPPGRHVGDHGFRLQTQPTQVVFHVAHALRRAIDGDNVRARRRQLRRLAAGRGAQVQHPPAAHVAQQLRRQRRRRVLNPPSAVVITRKLGDRSGVPAVVACRSATTSPQGVNQTIADTAADLDSQVERRFRQMGLGDRPRHGFAVGGCPGVPQPVRGVQSRGVLRVLPSCAPSLARRLNTALISEAWRARAPAARQVDGGMHRGVRRRPQEDELRDAQAKQVAHRCQPVRASAGARQHRSAHRSVPDGEAPSTPG